MREQIELLKNDADALPHQVELALAHAHPAAGGGHPSHWLAVDGDLARIERLQEVDAREERALAGSARPDHGDHLAAMHRQIDALEDLGAAVALVQVPDANHDRRRGAAFEARRRFPGAFQQRRPAPAARSRRGARKRAPRSASAMVVRLRSRMSTRLRAITWRARCAGEPKTRLASALVSSSCASGSSSNTMRSAGAPSAMVPARGSAAASLLTRWPPEVASARMVAVLGQAVASAVPSRGSKAASLIASQGFCVSLLAAPSVPSATATPAARNAGSGAIPLPSRMFDTGLCTTTVPVAASRSISGALTCTAWAHASLGPNRPMWSSCATLLRPLRVFDGLVHVGVHRQIAVFARDGPQQPIRATMRRRRPERQVHALPLGPRGRFGDERNLVRGGRRRGDVWRADERAGIRSIAQHEDRKSTRLNSSHLGISYAVFCLKKKIKATRTYKVT